MRKLITTAVAAAVGVIAALGFAMPASAISSTSADLSVLHGIPNTPVDVYVNGALTLNNFQPGTIAGPLDLPAGTYAVVLTKPGDPVTSPILQTSLPLEAGKSYTATANLDASGKPALNLFTNDISKTAAGQGRLTVRHVAAAPAVDVLANGAAAITGLTNPNEKSLDLPAGTISAAVALAGTTAPVIGPADVAIADGKLTIVYAWGSATDSTLALATQTITIAHSNPGGVTSGTAGYAAEQDQVTQALWATGGVAVVAIAAAALVLIRRNRVES